MLKQLVGFDIGEREVKIVQNGGSSIKRAVCVELPDDLVKNGVILSMDAMADFLRETVKENKISKAGAAVILPASLVFTKNCIVPLMNDSQLKYNLPYEFSDYLTEDKSHYFFDYAVREILTGENGEPDKMRLFACAALKSTIGEYRAMFRRMGLSLKVAVPAEYAFTALLKAGLTAKVPEGSAPQDLCIIDLGHFRTQLFIHHGDEHIIKRGIDLGMADLDRLIAEEAGVDIHVAHTRMISDYNGVLETPSAIELYQKLAVEIMKAVNFYNYNNREAALHDLYLCGGGAAIEPLCSCIGETTSMSVKMIDQLLPSAGNTEKPWLYAQAFGCTIRD